MKKILIDKFRIVPAPLTGFGWVAVHEWNGTACEYRHVSTFRSMAEAHIYVEKRGEIVNGPECY